jgi:hypothetical protein
MISSMLQDYQQVEFEFISLAPQPDAYALSGRLASDVEEHRW